MRELVGEGLQGVVLVEPGSGKALLDGIRQAIGTNRVCNECDRKAILERISPAGVGRVFLNVLQAESTRQF
jgi:hypothetical protein